MCSKVKSLLLRSRSWVGHGTLVGGAVIAVGPSPQGEMAVFSVPLGSVSIH